MPESYSTNGQKCVNRHPWFQSPSYFALRSAYSHLYTWISASVEVFHTAAYRSRIIPGMTVGAGHHHAVRELRPVPRACIFFTGKWREAHVVAAGIFSEAPQAGIIDGCWRVHVEEWGRAGYEGEEDADTDADTIHGVPSLKVSLDHVLGRFWKSARKSSDNPF